MEDREISREEAIKRLEKGEPFNELYDPLWEAALALAIKALKAEPVKQERCEFCKDGKTFWGAELILDNEGNWHNIEYCPICGAKMGEIEEEKTPRLIDANEILKSEHQHYAPMADEYYVPVRDIENAPTVDAVPLEDYKSMERTVNKLTKALADAEDKEFTLYADKKPIVTFKDSKIILHGERREDETDRR